MRLTDDDNYLTLSGACPDVVRMATASAQNLRRGCGSMQAALKDMVHEKHN